MKIQYIEHMMDGFINNLMNVNGFYPEIERFTMHTCLDGTVGIARLAGISLGD